MSTKVTPEVYLKPEEVCALLRFSRSKFYLAVEYDGLPCVRIGKVYRVPRAALEEWLRRKAQ